MNNNRNIFINKMLACLIFAISITACDQESIFTDEQYKKVIYLASDDDHIFKAVHMLDDKISRGYFSIGCGGSNYIDQDVSIELEPDTILFDKYNKSNFDIDTAKYAVLLDKSRYTIPSLSATLTTDNRDAYVKLPIDINLLGLSPDTTYFVPMSIKNVSHYEVNPDKYSVLYRVYMKNDYAEQQVTTYYTSKFDKTEEGDISRPGSASKIAHPLTKDKIRIFAGSQNFKADTADIRKWAMVVQIDKQTKLVSLSSYASIEIEQVGEPSENRYFEDHMMGTIYKRLFLHYRYRTLEKEALDSEPAQWSKWITVKESLRRLES